MKVSSYMQELMTLEELGRHLRFSRRTLYKMLEAGEIPAFKIGNKWRFDRATIDEWLKHKSRRGNFRILVIDDEPIIRELFKKIFDFNGYEIIAAENGAAGLQKLTDFNPDLVFLDLVMPKMDGSQILKEIRAVKPQLPVVIITGYPDSECMNRVLEFGPITVLKKPLSIDDIKSVAQSVLNTG
jgi:excisionase family DNA binding protein